MIENVCTNNKYGFCKFGNTCRFKHVDFLCETQNCDILSCEKRHPKTCFYQTKYGRCKFTSFCKYSHENKPRFCENSDKVSYMEKKIQEMEVNTKIAKEERNKLLLVLQSPPFSV